VGVPDLVELDVVDVLDRLGALGAVTVSPVRGPPSLASASSRAWLRLRASFTAAMPPAMADSRIGRRRRRFFPVSGAAGSTALAAPDSPAAVTRRAWVAVLLA